LRFAYSDLDLAQAKAGPRVMLEMLCFHAQQAAEKAIKPVLLKHAVEFPRTHNLQVLLELLPESVPVPPGVAQAAELTEYAVALRYPAESEPVTSAEHRQAVSQAGAVVAWAEGILQR
jgi:HEPN domain-containing protein